MKKCIICGPVKNCGKYLDKVFQNINKIGEIFDDYHIFIYYDYSTDNTLSKLQTFKSHYPTLITYYINNNPISNYRTYNLANARNYCLKYINEKNKELIEKQQVPYEYMIMMDMDDVNAKNCNPTILKKYLEPEYNDKWDALSFQSSPYYYDIWALSIYPFCFSYNHFRKNNVFYQIISKYVTHKLNQLPKNGLLSCISAFNGLAIYRILKTENCIYDGRINIHLLPSHLMMAHIKATQSKIIYKKYETVDGSMEDCEHRSFHIDMAKKNGALIRISPEKIMT